MSELRENDWEHARSLLEMARKDLDALAGMEDADTFADEIVGFHAQQAIEKALKAWIAAQGVAYPLTHDIEVLLNLLEEAGCDIDAFRELDRYGDFAVLFRYEWLEEHLLSRSSVVEEVRALFDRVQKILRA